MRTRAPAHRRSEAGSFVALVGGLGLLLFALWAVAYSATGDRLKSENFLRDRDRHTALQDEGLTLALTALSESVPSLPSHACVWPLSIEGQRKYVTTRLRLDDDGNWLVTATPSSKSEQRDLPTGSTLGF